MLAAEKQRNPSVGENSDLASLCLHNPQLAGIDERGVAGGFGDFRETLGLGEQGTRVRPQESVDGHRILWFG